MLLRPQRKAVRMIMRMNMNLGRRGMREGESSSPPWETAGPGETDGGDGSQALMLLAQDPDSFSLRREKSGGKGEGI